MKNIFQSLKFKLVLLFVAVILAANIVLASFSYKMAKNVLTETVRDEMKTVADKTANDIHNMNEIEFAALRALAALPFVKSDELTLEEKNTALYEVAELGESKYANVCFYDEKGISHIHGGEVMDFSSKVHFREARAGREYVSDPEYIADVNDWYQYYSVPVFDDNRKFKGAVVSVLKGDRINTYLNQFDIGAGRHPAIMNMQNGESIGNPNKKGEGQGSNVSELDKFPEFKKVIEAVIAGETGQTDFIDPFLNEKMTCSYRPIGDGTTWAVFCAVPYDYYFGMLNFLRNVLFAVFAVTIIVAIVIGCLVISILIKPLHSVKSSIMEIATGNADLTKRIPVSSRDEIGDVVSGFNTFTKKLQDIMRGLKESKSNLNLAGENLEASTQDTSASITEILENINSVHSQINNQSASVTQTASAVNEIASNIQSLEQMIESQSAGVTQASAAVEQMIGNINSVNSSMDKMAASFEELSQSSVSGANLQQNVNDKIENIKNQSETLQEANIAIASIAEQTNLLAMNAAIEAAHAGEAGKGFSVVADEIRKLSETSTAQSKTIGEELNNIKESIESVVSASLQSSQAFQYVTDKISETDELVRQIKAAMEEQIQGSKQINEALRTMNDSTVEVRSASHEMSEGNRQILEEVRILQDATDTMKQSMDEMSIGARKINETGAALSEIAYQMNSSIKEIGSQIDEFKV
ncbi:MAG: methyl-accepting chemotaxis protein [Treponema sp.]|nr:methyl-accepting chemotaxis protein [Spirochaetales bacterium]MDY4902171.1 methyl-accepting chemotaxis protein [Treponema sp.]